MLLHSHGDIFPRQEDSTFVRKFTLYTSGATGCRRGVRLFLLVL